MIRPATLYIAAAGVGLAVVYVLATRGRDVGHAVGSAVVDVADGLVTGVVEAVGQGVGVPKTNKSQCEVDKANGDTWAASFSCPAGEFLKYWWEK